MKLNQFDLFLFDLDDTLINTRYSYKLAQEHAIAIPCSYRADLIPALLLERLRSFAKQTGSGKYREYFRLFLNELGIFSSLEEKTIFSQMLERYETTYWSNLRPFTEGITFLNHLTQTKKKIALVSNGDTRQQWKKIQHVHLDKFFVPQNSFISGNYAAQLKKPSPFLVETACNTLNVLPEKSVFFGNTFEDIVAGTLAGVSTSFHSESCALPSKLSGKFEPDFLFDNWKSVLETFFDENREKKVF